MPNLSASETTFTVRSTFFSILALLISTLLLAEGSRDLYPLNKTGYRAQLRSSTAVTVNYPFPNLGVHYVYAVAGEKLALASSVQSATNPQSIRLTNTTGNVTTFNSSTEGSIPSRAAELAGPQLSGTPTGGRYAPIYYAVPTTGIYKVEFLSTQATNSTTEPGNTRLAESQWSQQTNNNGVVAWDVSVINSTGTAFIPGRVYTNVLNLSNGTSTPQDVGFYGFIYVLTEDGFQYRVNNNGNNGLYFTFFVNNNGFVDPTTKNPLYKSLNTTTDIGGNINNPNGADSPTQTTHKMFYTRPDAALPLRADGAVPGGSTWLLKTAEAPTVSAVSVVGAEGVPGQVSNKGGFIRYTASAKANYRIVIASDATPATFTPRTLTGAGTIGVNNVFWDGKGGNNLPIPAGNVPVKITVQLQGAEVHFPFFDMEYNTKGTIIELLDATPTYTVFWDDSEVRSVTAPAAGSNPDPKNNSHLPPTNSAGRDSRINGHIWGVGATGTSGQFGDEKSIDTWTFVTGPSTTITTALTVKVADLKVSSITADKDKVQPGEVVNFTVRVKNDGPDGVSGAPFTLYLPPGFSASTFTFNGNGCGTAGQITFDPLTRKLSSPLALPNGCEVTITIPVTVGTSTQGLQNFSATILRPNDVTDPDATNPNPAIPPTDPFYECANNGLATPCNNIRALKLFYSPAEVCFEQVLGETFTATDGNPKTFNQPATNYGFVFDIFSLDNSFNMTINGVQLATSEIEFQSDKTTGMNVRFQDGTEYETGTDLIREMTGTPAAPLIRVEISPTGAVSLSGSKVSGGPLFPLELFNGNSLNPIAWNTTAPNVVTITQRVVDTTNITGRGYGRNIIPCICFNPANTTGTAQDTKMGITLLQRAGAAAAGNWPMARKGGHIALESNTKGFVVTRVSTAGLAGITAPQEGMMVYDTTAKCLKIYADGAWSCFSTATCP